MNQNRSDLLEGALVEPVDEKNKEIFLFYDFLKPTNENIQALTENFDRNELMSAVNYIKETYNDSHQLLVQRIGKTRTKPAYAANIKSFLNGILPLKCEVCNDTYCHTTTENAQDNEVTCLICKRFSHKECHVDKPECTPGTYYVCSICVDSIENRKQAAAHNNKEESVIEEVNLTQGRGMSVSTLEEDEEAIPNGQGSPKSNAAEKPNEDGVDNAYKESENQICPLYLEGRCPHGMRGRNCSYEHPKRC